MLENVYDGELQERGQIRPLAAIGQDGEDGEEIYLGLGGQVVPAIGNAGFEEEVENLEQLLGGTLDQRFGEKGTAGLDAEIFLS